MKQQARRPMRGFTLVELMIVVAIIGVLAALAIYGVRRYLASAKTSEAKNTIGAISRNANAAFERENAPSEALSEGTTSANATHSLCGSAALVPAAVPAGKKYQPNTAEGKDYDADSQTVGWKCLRFQMSQPHYYQYKYSKDAKQATNNPASCTAPCYEAFAKGDLDGDGTTFGIFAISGEVSATGSLKKSTQVYIENEYE